MTDVRVRFAPSPTGALHIGGAHTALFNWLWAKKHGGSFVLRIEDTDRERSTQAYEDTIYAGLRWLGLDWDEGPDCGGPYGPYRQSERLKLYIECAEDLVSRGLAYRDGAAIIFKIPQGETISFKDAVYGTISVKSETLKDQVLIKSDGTPTYNYAVVIDDHHMAINWVIRGEDHIANTPKQILFYKAFGWELPHFAHLPMILGKDKKKLSKRHGATSVHEYKDMGYLPEAVFNFLALLGWSPGGDKEIFTRDEAIRLFEISRVVKRAAIFDMDKLNYVNQEHIKMMDPKSLVDAVLPFWKKLGLPVEQFDRSYLERAVSLLEGRGRTLVEIAEFTDYFFDFDSVTKRYDGKELADKAESLRPFFRAILAIEPWEAPQMENFARHWCEERGMKLKDVAMPLRLALTGRKVSPGIFEVVQLLGRDEVKKRLFHYSLI